MSKQELIAQIHGFNQSANEQYLLLFTEQQLQSYLNRLRQLGSHAKRGTIWVRPAESPAIVRRSVVQLDG
ncbi:MAG: hypothetical protein JJU36_17160 [Phycisphaeraceae bacterium]|nr:hypothetical protein [Phycisphaeraceae bacterium]